MSYMSELDIKNDEDYTAAIMKAAQEMGTDITYGPDFDRLVWHGVTQAGQHVVFNPTDCDEEWDPADTGYAGLIGVNLAAVYTLCDWSEDMTPESAEANYLDMTPEKRESCGAPLTRQRLLEDGKQVCALTRQWARMAAAAFVSVYKPWISVRDYDVLHGWGECDD